jgi:hypothetical protein
MMGSVRQTTEPDAYRWGIGSFAVILASALSVGCSADEDRAAALGATKGGADYCSALCSWYRACGNDVSQSCVTSCRVDGRTPSYARLEFLELLGNCLAADRTCSGGSEASWRTCYQEAAWTIAPTQPAFDACSTLGTYFFECGYTNTPSGCAGDLMYYDDRVLDRISICDEANCGELWTCVEHIFGGA